MGVSQLLLILCCIYALTQAQSPPTPKISDSFLALVNITIYDKEGEHHGNGLWGANQPAGKGIQYYDFDHTKYGFTILERYDLGKQFDFSAETQKCTEFALNGTTMPLAWSWLQIANFVGTAGYEKESVDIWETKIGYATMRLGVQHTNPSIPVYLVRESRDEKRVTYFFASWSASAPDDSHFEIPSECSTSSDAYGAIEACVSRSDTLARAKVWVAHKVPYNQGGDYEGYREDCSGFVSMTWGSTKPGHTTSTMHEIAHAISKADLQLGDCLLNAGEHVVYFGGWTNSERTYYQAYEETRPGEGTVTRNTPYPYWYQQSEFKPYRYNDIC